MLTGLFDGVRGGGTISLPQVDAGLDPILSAVREGGLTRWLETVWTHDDATYQHCLLVAGVAAQFVLHLGFRTEDREHFVRAALLHDVGKAQIPREILNKPGRLTADEMAIMRRHPVIGYDILRESGCDAATLGAVRHHHEMLDGSGYPDGLVGAEISDTVRLLTICDIYAALTERRSYKPPMPPRDAMAILRRHDRQARDERWCSVSATRWSPALTLMTRVGDPEAPSDLSAAERYSAASRRGRSTAVRSRFISSAVRNASSSACSALRRGSQ